MNLQKLVYIWEYDLPTNLQSFTQKDRNEKSENDGDGY